MAISKLEHLSKNEKRLAILVGGTVVDREKMKRAAENIDKLRRKVPHWDAVEEIRKWRETR